MHIPSQFEEPRVDVMHELMRANPLATLVTLSPDGIEANHIPLHLSADPLPYGTLRGHVARANPVWRHFSKDTAVLALFHGPQAYVSPSWYATKAESGRVAPTWNYTTVHAYGELRVIDDAAWLRQQLEALTDHNEKSLAEPWQLSDAPDDFIERLMRAIVGIEIVITKLLGKWKVSQNQSRQNQLGVVQGLNATGREPDAAMAALVASRIDGAG